MADFELPGYELYERLGRGGMATVYRALHLNLDREVAIKVMDPAMNADESFSERFIREARISARLIHPHILQIYDVNTFNGLNYIAMELLPGGELADFIHGEMPQKQIYILLRQMTEALDYAAGRGYVHRDIKPSNIMLRAPEDFVLADFGIARAANSGTQMTQTGLMVGTPSYMSPEQAKGEDVDGRSDIYALGVLTYEMLTKHLPYESESAVTTAVKHLTEAIPTLKGNLEPYQDFINKALAKSPDDRFQTGAEFYAGFMAASSGFDDDQVLTPAAPPKPSRSSSAATSAPAVERTSLAGVNSTRMSHSSSSAVSGSSRPYKLENSQQRERLVSGAYERPRKKKSGSSAGVWAAIVLVLAAAGGGGFYWWQGQQKSAGGGNQRAVTSELAQAYNAMSQDKLSTAAESFRMVLSLDSQNAGAQQGMDELARLYPAAIDKAIASGDDNTAERLLKQYGKYFAGAADLAELRQRLDALLGQKKGIAERRERFGELMADVDSNIASGDLDKADELLQQAASLQAESPELDPRRQALKAAREKNAAYEQRWSAYTDEQRKAFAEAMESADAALDSDDLDAAATALASAAAIAPDAQELVSRNKRLEDARAQNEQAVAEERARIDARLDEADTLVKGIDKNSNNADQAVAIYTEIGTQYPDEARVEAGMAAVAAQFAKEASAAAAKGDFEAARASLARADELVPGQKPVDDLKAKLPAMEKDWQQREAALADERAALKAAIDKAEDAVSDAQKAASSGDIEAAQASYDSVKQQNPDLPSLRNLGKSLRDAYEKAAREQVALSEFDSAEEWINRGAEHFPDDPRWQALRSEVEEAQAGAHRRLGVY